MKNSKIEIKGAELYKLLIDLGFKKNKINKTHSIYVHKDGAEMVFKNVRWNEYVSQSTYSLVSTTLFYYGLSDKNTFKTTISL